MKKKELNPIALALGVSGMLACSSALASENPFDLAELSDSTFQVAGEEAAEEGEGSCGEGKCGEDGDAEEGEGSCGEGKCGEGEEGEEAAEEGEAEE